MRAQIGWRTDWCSMALKPDTLVGLCVERSNELVVAILAILKAGGAYLPIDLAYPADRLAFMLEDAQAPVLADAEQAGGRPARHARESHFVLTKYWRGRYSRRGSESAALGRTGQSRLRDLHLGHDGQAQRDR